MSSNVMYDLLSQDYDRFVNWDARLAAELPFLLSELAGVESGGQKRILDVGCGTGQHALALAEQGFDCIGVDPSQAMIDLAAQNAHQRGLSVDFETAGLGQMVDLFGENAFDGILCLGNTLPHLLNQADLDDALHDLFAALRPGGTLLIQNQNYDRILAEKARWMPPETYREGQMVWVFLRFYDFISENCLRFNLIRLLSDSGEDFAQQRLETLLWPMTQGQLTDSLIKAGFQDLRFFDSLQGDPYQPLTSPNLVMIAKGNA